MKRYTKDCAQMHHNNVYNDNGTMRDEISPHFFTFTIQRGAWVFLLTCAGFALSRRKAGFCASVGHGALIQGGSYNVR